MYAIHTNNPNNISPITYCAIKCLLDLKDSISLLFCNVLLKESICSHILFLESFPFTNDISSCNI